MRALFICIGLLLSTVGDGHPSWGLVVNDKGEIYFVDVLHNNGTLWKIQNESELIAILSDFHAHDMQMDADGNLWIAENLWVQGEIEGDGRHTLLKVHSDLTIDTLIVTEDIDLFHGTNISIWNDRIFFTNNKQLYEYRDGKSQLALKHKFKNVKNMLMDDEGVLWIADSKFKNGSLYKLDQKGKLTLYASDIMPEDPQYPLFKESHLQFMTGIAKDGEGNIYVSENAGCRIIKINRIGEKSIFHQSPSLWSPMNVAFYKGDAYIMEVGFNKGHKGPRILKKDKNGAISRIANVDTAEVSTVTEMEEDEGINIPTWVYFGLGLLIFALVIILSVRKEYKSQ